MVTRRMIMLGGWADIYQKAKAAGFDLTLVQLKSDIKSKDIEIVDQLISSELSDKLVLDLVETIHMKHPFDVSLSFSELGLLNAALVADRLGIEGNPLKPVLLTRDKVKMRENMQAGGVPSIPHAAVRNAADAIRFGNDYGWPIIVKPANGVGSRQIHKLFAPADAYPAFAAIDGDASTAGVIKHDFPDMRIIAEKFIEGAEVSVEAITWEGRHTVLGVTDKITTGYPRFVESGHTMPSVLPAETVAQINALVVRFLDSIEHRYGPSHTEVIVSDDGPIIVESHTRTGGDRIFEMVELAYGVDMFGATLQGFAGAFPDIEPVRRGGAAIRYLTVDEGRVLAIDGLDEAARLPGVVRCDITLKVGDRAKAFIDSNVRYGYVLATGETAQQAAANAERALAQIRITLASHDA
jgi:biotin carboxylase